MCARFHSCGCPYGIWSCVAGVLDPKASMNPAPRIAVQQAVGCAGHWGNGASCVWSFLRCKCPGPLSGLFACIAQALGPGDIRPRDASVGLGLSPLDPRDVYVARSTPA